MDKEFEEKCLARRTITLEPSVFPIATKELQNTIISQHKNNAKYFLESARNLLATNTALAAVILAYFAMEHKANELLAVRGYKVESHVCTQAGLSRIVQRKDLAKQLSEIFTLRQNIGYRLTLTQSKEKKLETEQVINEIAIPFLQEVDKLIQEP